MMQCPSPTPIAFPKNSVETATNAQFHPMKRGYIIKRMNPQNAEYKRATKMTAASLKEVAAANSTRTLSRLSLPEIDAVIDLVAQVIPAGNVPGMILSGLTRLPGQRPPIQKVQQDVNILFKEMERVIETAKYGAFFAGPAAVIWGYQNLLKLAGKDAEESFPEGVWQFYADYALREDTARHANETHGFDTALKQHHIQLDPIDRLTAWTMAAIMCLHRFDALLENEWRERAAATLAQDELRHTGSARVTNIYRAWESQRPYRRDNDAAGMDYPEYRKHKFERYLKNVLQTLPTTSFAVWEEKLNAALREELPAYQQQMTILARLDPGPYGETRVRYDAPQARVGIVHRNGYYLLPICEPGTNRPLDVNTARAQIAAIVSSPSAAPTSLEGLARVKRSALPKLRETLHATLNAGLQQLSYAPILINSDKRERPLPLSELRQAERGIGDHALTIFDTGETFVFDQSHIFFDGAWGAALAEIMTNEALSWATYLTQLPTPVPARIRVYEPLALPMESSDADQIEKAPRVMYEVGAETDNVSLTACLSLRKQFKQRNDLLQLTINDLLVLYRAIHVFTYEPSLELLAQLNQLEEQEPDVVRGVREALKESRQVNPSILIPIDASQPHPRDRVYPLNIEVPLADLDLISLHKQTIEALDAYEKAGRERTGSYTRFNRLQKNYLASLAGFGAIMSKAREIAKQGESASVGAIRLLAHLHPAIQQILDKVPERFDALNNILKGREVFSNVGAVSPSSALSRFLTAKDDNNLKQMAWGVITDSKGTMRISLRDFRPHVTALKHIGKKELAKFMTQDYLDKYTDGLNIYVKELSRITKASRETKPVTGKQKRAHE